MGITEIAGYGAALCIGLSLGLIGGGGSILTVPVLVYLLGVNPVLSTAYSLFVVGTTALAGSFAYMRNGLVDYRTAVVFGIPSIIAVYLTRKLVVPAIPDVLFTIGSLSITKNIFVMLLFAVLMVAASFSMIRGRKYSAQSQQEEHSINYPLVLLEGMVVGILTGLVGAGGGFLIIPALVLLARLPMKTAVGTSLLIIAAKSLIGFTGDIGSQPIDWIFMLVFTSLAVIGILLGSYVSRFISDAKLKPAFGWFVLLMGIYILIKELVL